MLTYLNIRHQSTVHYQIMADLGKKIAVEVPAGTLTLKGNFFLFRLSKHVSLIRLQRLVVRTNTSTCMLIRVIHPGNNSKVLFGTHKSH